jgi:CheY-like chemotaxis protein
MTGTTEGNERRVLIVDDDKLNMDLLGSIMNFKEVAFDVAEDGKRAVEKWQNGHYDLIFMDINMPVMNGYEAAKLIRSKEEEMAAQPVPIVAVTSVQAPLEAKKFGLDGFDHYIEKPFRVSQILDIMTYFFNR